MGYAKIKNRLMWFNLLILFGIFPLIFTKNYKDIGIIKFDLFWTLSLICVSFVQVFSLAQMLEGNKLKKPILSSLDIVIIVYAIANTISFLFSPYKAMVLMGAEGWCMGYAPQMLFVVLYFTISRCMEMKKLLINVMLATSGIVYLIGVLHRLRFDPFQIYENMDLDREMRFTSTMGNVSWYSCFICIIFPVGLYIFYSAKDKKNKLYAAIYTVIGFMAIVTQNTDSVYMGLTGIFLILFYLSFQSRDKMLRFAEVILLMLISFKLTGVLQIIFKERALVLDPLSTWMSQSFSTTLILVVCAIIYLFMRKMKGDETPIPKKYFWILFWILIAGIVATIVFIILNTKGVFLEWFGFQTKINYLYFNVNWGHERGFIWTVSMDAYERLPLIHKIFGVGPDGYRAYLYAVPDIEKILREVSKDAVYTNAHNEYLNLMITVGVMGVTTFLGVLGTGIKRFVGIAKENPFVPVFALSIIGYACHNIFCYQQVFGTPFLFILMGIGENLIRNHKKEIPVQTE